MDDFEVAVLLSLDPTQVEASVYQQAVEYVGRLEVEENGWRFCLERLVREDYRPQTRFWCAEFLIRTLNGRGLVPSAREEVRTVVVPLLKTVGAGSPPSSSAPTPTSTTTNETTEAPSYLINKIAHLFGILVGLDYPSRWPRAFQDGLLPLLDLEHGIEVFFSILQVVDDDLTSRRAADLDSDRAVRVKDAMRDDCVEQLAGTFTTMLRSPRRRYVVLALDSIRRFAEWMDIGLVLNRQFIELVHGATLGREGEKTSAPLASTAAAVRAVLAKGMSPGAKLELLQSIRAVDLLAALQRSAMVAVESTNEEEEADLNLALPSIECAKLVNQIALEAIECLRALGSREAAVIAQAALPVALSLAREDDDSGATSETIEFINEYIRLCRGNDESNLAGLTAILAVIIDRACFPPDVDPSDDSVSGDFHALRSNFFTMYKNITRIAPALALSSVQHILREESSREVQNPAKAELAITLLNLSSEVLIEGDDETLNSTVAIVLSNTLTCMKAEAVGTQSALVELHRTYAFFALFTLAYHSHRLLTSAGDDDVLRGILTKFFDVRGLRHPNSALHRSRTAELLVKFFVRLRPVLAERHLHDTVYAIYPLITGPTPLTEKDVLTLCEALGLILGFHSNSPSRCDDLELVLRPIIENLNNIADNSSLVNQGLRQVTCAGNIAKGFTAYIPEDSDTDNRLLRLWTTCFQVVLNFYSAFSEDPEVNKSTLFFIQTVAEPLGERILVPMDRVLLQLVSNSQSPLDLARVLELINQLAAHFRAKSSGLINAVYLATAKRVFSFPFEAGVSEEAREGQELRKVFLKLLASLLTKQVHRAMISDENLPVLEMTVAAVLRGAAGEGLDASAGPTVMKLCFQLLARMVALWTLPLDGNGAREANGDDAVEVPGFRQFVLNKMASTCVLVAVEAPFFVQNGYHKPSAEKILLEIIALQKIAAERCGDEFCRRLVAVMGQASSVTAGMAREYVDHLPRDDPATLLGPWIVILKAMRK